MHIVCSKPLFAWDALEDSPTLQTLRTALRCVPDARLLAALRAHRGRGRDDYPVHVLWGVVLVRVLCRHVSWEAVLDDLRRNPALRALLGIEGEDEVPRKWNVSRFLTVLGAGPHLSLLGEVFDAMVERLATVVDDLGEHVAGDATALSARPARGKGANPDASPSQASRNGNHAALGCGDPVAASAPRRLRPIGYVALARRAADRCSRVSFSTAKRPSAGRGAPGNQHRG